MEKLITNEPGVMREVRAVPRLCRGSQLRPLRLRPGPGFLHTGLPSTGSPVHRCPGTWLLAPQPHWELRWAARVGSSRQGTWPPLRSPCSFGKRRQLKINLEKGEENEDRKAERGRGGSP